MAPAPTIESLIIERSKRLIYRLIASAAVLFIALWTVFYLGFQSENARKIAQGLEGQVEYLTKIGDQFTMTRLLSSLIGGGPFQTAAVFDGGGQLVVVVPEGAAVITPRETAFEFSRGGLTLWHCIIQSDSRLPAWGTLCVATRSSPWAAVWAAAVLVLFLLGLSLAWLNGFKRLAREIADPVVDFATSILNSDLSSVRHAAGTSKDFGLDEVNQLSKVFERFWAKSVEYDARAREMEVESAMNKIATQVAHDIRSPLAALEAAAGSVAQLPEGKRIMIRSAVGRIRDIANNLLDRHRGQAAGAASAAPEAASPQLLSSLIDPVVSEKRLQYRSQSRVVIELKLDPSSYGLFAAVQPVEFKRLVSNLVNNAVESFGEGAGTVSVGLSSRDGRALVSVEDDGKGIPPGVLAKLGQRGETHGKAGGSGLGLYHARTSAESWCGSLELASELGKGTTATLVLPLANAPEWFVSELMLVPGKAVVILDDDASIHQVWQERLDALKAGERGVYVVHVSTPEEVRNWVKTEADSREALYLFDYELLGHPETGLSLAAELGLSERMVLVTSRYAEKDILERCLRLKARLIPKGLAGSMPMRIEGPAASARVRARPLDAVLIDDDPLTRMIWENAASDIGKSLRTFATAAEFFTAAGEIDRATPIYMDSNLGEGMEGAAESLRAYELGFGEIYLATGHEPGRFATLKHLRGVIGKDPPWSA